MWDKHRRPMQCARRTDMRTHRLHVQPAYQWLQAFRAVRIEMEQIVGAAALSD